MNRLKSRANMIQGKGYREDKRPFHASPTTDDCCRIARKLCNTSPNLASMEPGGLKSPLSAIRPNESLPGWPERIIRDAAGKSKTRQPNSPWAIELVAPGFLLRQRAHWLGLSASDDRGPASSPPGLRCRQSPSPHRFIPHRSRCRD